MDWPTITISIIGGVIANYLSKVLFAWPARRRARQQQSRLQRREADLATLLKLTASPTERQIYLLHGIALSLMLFLMSAGIELLVLGGAIIAPAIFTPQTQLLVSGSVVGLLWAAIQVLRSMLIMDNRIMYPDATYQANLEAEILRLKATPAPSV
ncbi:MAG: hypothetical protein M3Z04_22280 [Chloroflexota bacterium]|nr:hypothetical protein [Chloroflexota bacterium]